MIERTLYGMKVEPSNQQAQCPECEQWSDLEILGNHLGGYWWRDSCGCPECGEIICVESECSFRTKTDTESELTDIVGKLKGRMGR